MKNTDLLEIFDKLEEDYDFIGIRFEDKKRKVGDICGSSKDNPDREDEREFPEYGTDEYAELAELDGTCAWTIDEFRNKDIDERKINTYHGYIVASNSIGHGNYVPDENEILIVDAKVVHIIF